MSQRRYATLHHMSRVDCEDMAASLVLAFEVWRTELPGGVEPWPVPDFTANVIEDRVTGDTVLRLEGAVRVLTPDALP